MEERDQEEEGGNKKADRELHTEGAKEEVLEEGEDVETEDEALLVCDDNQLMAHFHKVLAVSSAEGILEKVFPSMSTLEGRKRVTGSLDFARK